MFKETSFSNKKSVSAKATGFYGYDNQAPTPPSGGKVFVTSDGHGFVTSQNHLFITKG